MSKLEWHQLKELNAAWLSCELLPAKAISGLTRCIERSEEITAELNSFVGDDREVRRDITMRLAAGDLTTAQAIVELVALTSGKASATSTNAMPRFLVLREDVMNYLRREAEAFVRSADLYAVYDRVREKIERRQQELAKAFEGIDNVDAALRSDDKNRRAWIELQDLGRKIAPLGNVYVALIPLELREQEAVGS